MHPLIQRETSFGTKYVTDSVQVTLHFDEVSDHSNVKSEFGAR